MCENVLTNHSISSRLGTNTWKHMQVDHPADMCLVTVCVYFVSHLYMECVKCAELFNMIIQ